MERVNDLMSDLRKGLLKLAWPVIVAMLFTTMLNFVDFFFVGGHGSVLLRVDRKLLQEALQEL